MARESNLGNLAIGTFLSVSLFAFGVYLGYDRVFLSIQAGEIEERYGTIERAVEPISFWISVSMFGAFSAGFVLIGLYALVSVVRYQMAHMIDNED